jgi:hypothetical protein
MYCADFVGRKLEAVEDGLELFSKVTTAHIKK